MKNTYYFDINTSFSDFVVHSVSRSRQAISGFIRRGLPKEQNSQEYSYPLCLELSRVRISANLLFIRRYFFCTFNSLLLASSDIISKPLVEMEKHSIDVVLRDSKKKIFQMDFDLVYNKFS